MLAIKVLGLAPQPWCKPTLYVLGIWATISAAGLGAKGTNKHNCAAVRVLGYAMSPQLFRSNAV